MNRSRKKAGDSDLSNLLLLYYYNDIKKD